MNATSGVMAQIKGSGTQLSAAQSVGVGLQSSLHGHETRRDEAAAMTGLSIQQIQGDRGAAIDQARWKRIPCLQTQEAEPAIDTQLFRF